MKRLFFCIFLFLSFSYSPQSEGAGLRKAWDWVVGAPHKASIAAARTIGGDDVFSDPTIRSTGQSVLNVMDKGIAIAMGVFAGQVFGEFITGGGGVVAGITTGVVVAVSVLYDPIFEKATGMLGSCKRAFREKNWKEMASDGTALVLGAGAAAPWIPLGVALLVQTLVPHGKCLKDVPYAKASGTALAVFGVIAVGEMTRILSRLILSDNRREAAWGLWREGDKHYGSESLSRTFMWRMPFVFLGLSSLKAIDMFSRYASLAFFLKCPNGQTPATPDEWTSFQHESSDFTNGVWISGIVPVGILVASGWQYGGLVHHTMSSGAWSPVFAFMSANFVGIFSGVVVSHSLKNSVLPKQSLLVSMPIIQAGLGQLLAYVNSVTVNYSPTTFNIFSGFVLSNAGKVLEPLQVGSGLMLGSNDVLLQVPLAITSTMAVTVLLYPGLERFFNRLVHSDVIDKIDGIGLLRRHVADMSLGTLQKIMPLLEKKVQQFKTPNGSVWVANPLEPTNALTTKH